MFQIKNFRSIVASMINRARATNSRLTDWSVGSVARTMVEAPAAEIEELYLQMLLGLQEAIPVSIYQAFGFERLDALPSSGVLRFSALSAGDADVRIPAGTKVRAPSAGVEFATLADVVLLAGDTEVNVLAVGTVHGAAGNVASGAVSEIVNPVTGVDVVTNLVAFSGGRDTESDGQRKTRFLAYVSTLSRGTAAALRYGASTAVLRGAQGEVVERVAHVEVIDPYLTDHASPVGWVRVYVHNGVGSTSPTLVAEVARVLAGYRGSDGRWVPGWKAAGVQIDVLACPEVPVAVSVVLSVGVGSIDPAEALGVVQDYISEVPVGGGVLRAELIARLMALPGALNVTLADPVADVSVLAYQKVVPGAVTIT